MVVVVRMLASFMYTSFNIDEMATYGLGAGRSQGVIEALVCGLFVELL